MKKLYVNGFMFDDEGFYMAFVKKLRFPPNVDWTNNPYNGIGGKIEAGESNIDAMIREFWEETGVLTLPSDWVLFAVCENPQWVVFYFKAFNTKLLSQVATQDEPIVIRPAVAHTDTVKHLSFLLPLALYPNQEGAAMFREISDEPRNDQAISESRIEEPART